MEIDPDIKTALDECLASERYIIILARVDGTKVKVFRKSCHFPLVDLKECMLLVWRMLSDLFVEAGWRSIHSPSMVPPTLSSLARKKMQDAVRNKLKAEMTGSDIGEIRS